MEDDNAKPANRGLRLVSASGLDERQIAAEDIAALQALFVPIEAKLGVGAQNYSLDLESLGLAQPPGICDIPLGVPEPRPLRIKVEPLPKIRRPKRLPVKAPRLRFHKDLQSCMKQPIRRRKLRLSMLTEEQQANMSRELQKKFGPGANELNLVAAFAHIPPESAKTIRLDQDLRYATFVPTGSSRNKTGYFLLILEGKENKTEKVLVRL